MTTPNAQLREFDRQAKRRPEHPLVAARRVRGAAVFGNAGRRLGRVRDVALDKRTGCVAYVILAYGGVLGLGRRLHAVPWRFLSYDTARGGYVVPCQRHDLEREQGFRSDQLSGWAPPVPKARDLSLYPTASGFLPPY